MKNFYKQLIILIAIYLIFLAVIKIGYLIRDYKIEEFNGRMTAISLEKELIINDYENKIEEIRQESLRRIEETKRYWYFEDGSKIKASQIFDYYKCQSN